MFDPNTEEAIASVGGGDGSEIIIETKAKGYSLNGRCIRYAKVIVGSGGNGRRLIALVYFHRGRAALR